MSFDFDVSDELKAAMRKLQSKDKVRMAILNKKIKEIVDNNTKSIDRYKNLRYSLNDYKRAHIDKSFVLIFQVDKGKSHILFDKLEHHDKIYK